MPVAQGVLLYPTLGDRCPIKPTSADNYRKLACPASNTCPVGTLQLKKVAREDLARWPQNNQWLRAASTRPTMRVTQATLPVKRATPTFSWRISCYSNRGVSA